MARATFVCRVVDGKMTLIPKHEAERLPVARSTTVSLPMLARDAMDPVEHPCDGRLYDSKSAFRAVTKANGYLEMGNDPARLRPNPKPLPDDKSISDAVDKAFARAERGETV